MTVHALCLYSALLSISLYQPIARAQPAPSLSPTASSTSATPAAGSLLHEAIQVISARALGAGRLDWQAIETELAAQLKPDASLTDAHALIEQALKRLGDRHASLIVPKPLPSPAATTPTPPPGSSASTNKPVTPASTEPTAPAAPPAPARVIPSSPQSQMLEGQIAYLIVPGCMAPDADGLRAYAHEANRAIRDMVPHKPIGWIVDLRLNGGGNIWPMLLGLRPLLSDGTVMTMTRGDAIESRFGVDEHAAWMDWNGTKQTQLDWAGNEPPSTQRIDGPVAVLLGSWTMSSGEGLAISFASRQLASPQVASPERVRFFGEPTSGLTTVTNYFPLAVGSTLNLPVSNMADAHGKPRVGAITPDEPVAMGDWPTATDAAVQAATKWIQATTANTDLTAGSKK